MKIKASFSKSEISMIVNTLRESNMLPAEKFGIGYDGIYNRYFLVVAKGKRQQKLTFMTDVTKCQYDVEKLGKQLRGYLMK